MARGDKTVSCSCRRGSTMLLRTACGWYLSPRTAGARRLHWGRKGASGRLPWNVETASLQLAVGRTRVWKRYTTARQGFVVGKELATNLGLLGSMPRDPKGVELVLAYIPTLSLARTFMLIRLQPELFHYRTECSMYEFVTLNGG